MIVFKMPAKMKEDWVAALRSGKYKQGRGRLRRKYDKYDTYCCLGVLQMVVDGKVEEKDEISLAYISKEWAESNGIILDYPNLFTVSTSENDASNLSYLNDSGVSFEEIADLIEEQVIGY